MLFLAAFYWCNIYIYAMTYSFDRYAESLSPVRFLIIGIGLCLIFDALWRACRSAAFYNRAQNSLKETITMEASCLRYLWQEAFLCLKASPVLLESGVHFTRFAQKALAFSRGIIYNISNLKSLE